MLQDPHLPPLFQTLGPKILTAVECGKLIEVHPAICTNCRKPLGMIDDMASRWQFDDEETDE